MIKKLLLITLLLAVPCVYAMDSEPEKSAQGSAGNIQPRDEAQLHKVVQGDRVVVLNAQGEQIGFYTKNGALIVLSRSYSRWLQESLRN
jgi:hypothetical protein